MALMERPKFPPWVFRVTWMAGSRSFWTSDWGILDVSVSVELGGGVGFGVHPVDCTSSRAAILALRASRPAWDVLRLDSHRLASVWSGSGIPRRSVSRSIRQSELDEGTLGVACSLVRHGIGHGEAAQVKRPDAERSQAREDDGGRQSVGRGGAHDDQRGAPARESHGDGRRQGPGDAGSQGLTSSRISRSLRDLHASMVSGDPVPTTHRSPS
jgi:hypothetical protein